MASIGTCAGYYVAKFCRKRGLSTEDVRIRQRTIEDPSTHLVNRVEIEVDLPEDFPKKYHAAVIRAAQLCTVKKHLELPPTIEVRTTTGRVPVGS